jgi:hypothetical protein
MFQEIGLRMAAQAWVSGVFVRQHGCAPVLLTIT